MIHFSQYFDLRLQRHAADRPCCGLLLMAGVSCKTRNRECTMAIYTPRGLKIRLPIDYSFALMTRLYPRITPFKFLKVTEALELLPAAWASIAAVLAFFTLKSPYTVCAVVAGVQIIAHVMRMSALPIPRIVTGPANIYSYGSGYGIFLILICALGYLKLGWQGVAAFLVVRAAAGLVNGIIA